jgi:hypothetical protein
MFQQLTSDRAKQKSQTNYIASIFQQPQHLAARQDLSAAATGAVHSTIQEIRHLIEFTINYWRPYCDHT